MSTPSNNDPRIDQAAVTDDSLLATHEKFLGKQPDDKGHYKLMPLGLLFAFSGLIFFAGTYLNRYAGEFQPTVFDPHLVPSHQPKGNDTPQVDPIEMGRKLYNNAACNTCHQANGTGTPGAIPPLAGSEWVAGSEERVIRIVLHGLQGPITVAGQNYSSAMPAFGRVPGSAYNWTDDKVAAVVSYIRKEWGGKTDVIPTEKVAEIRNKEGARAQWTAADLQKIP